MQESRSLKAAKRAQQGKKKNNTQQHLATKLGISAPLRPVVKVQPSASLQELLIQAKPAVRQAIAQVAKTAPLVVFFSFTNATERARVVNFRGKDVEHIWQQLETWQQREFKTPPTIRWLRVDWVVEQRPLTWQALPDQLNSHKRNYFRYGLALDVDFKHAFLEQELNANAMLYPRGNAEQACVNSNNFLKYARHRFDKSFQLPSEPIQPIFLFATEAIFFQPKQAPVPLHGYSGGLEGRNTGRRVIKRLDVPVVEALIQQSSQFLAEQVNNKGRFIYGIHPCFDREINAYNTLRHASATYAMLEAWEVTQSKELKAAIDRSLYYLSQELIRCSTATNGDAVAYLQDANGEIKLGGNAVCLLALVKYTELTEDQRYLSLLEQLALGILHLQNPETGQFIHVLNADDLSVKEAFRTIYYDGEAAFGLMRLYGLTRDERWLEVVVKAFDYFIAQQRWKFHDHWLSYCVNELTLYHPEERYFQFGIQNLAGHLDFVIERITTFPTLLELMMAAHKMIVRLRQSEQHHHLLGQLDLDKFYHALEARAHYLLNGFFWPEVAMYFKNPQRILGSFFIRHHSFRVRIDDVEHYLSGFVAYLQHYLPERYRPAAKPWRRALTGTGAEAAGLGQEHGQSQEQSQNQAQGWDAHHVSQATTGEWTIPPAEGWQATGLSFTRLSFEPGHMAVLRSPNGRRGMPAAHIQALPTPPSAVVLQDDEATSPASELPHYRVASVDDAILDFGRYARSRFSGRVVGVTGSAGKTSSVALLQTLLGHWGKAGASRLSGNLPHGIAWNLASMDWQASFQVVEMAIGKMALNSSIARPDVAVFLNVGPAHLEFHKTTEQVALRKSRIFDAMTSGSHAVINRDMDEWPLVVAAAQRQTLNVISFGTHEQSDIRWLNPSPLTTDAGAEVAIGERRVTLPLYGQGAHVVMNIMAALGTMLALGLPYAEVLPGLAALEKVEGRGQEWQQRCTFGTLTLLDDAYNANPLSMKALLDQLTARRVTGHKHLILGDMLELGEGSDEYHRELVPDIAAAGVSSLVLVGEQMQALAPQLERSIAHVACANDHDQARLALLPRLAEGDLVVAKGSNKFNLSGLLKHLTRLSYVVLDEAEGELISAQSTLPFRPGSLVKLVTAMVVLDHVQDLSRTLTVEAGDMVGGSGANLKVGDTLTVNEALHNLLIPSSNRAAQALARMVGRELLLGHQPSDQAIGCFIHAMNEKAQALGATSTRLATASGLHHRDMYSTASDVARISRAAFGYPLIEHILAKMSHELEITGAQPRRLTIKSRIEPLVVPESVTVTGGKTGTLVGTAENLMVRVVLDGRPVLAVLMQQGGSRWHLMSGLLEEALEAAEAQRVKAQPAARFGQLKRSPKAGPGAKP